MENSIESKKEKLLKDLQSLQDSFDDLAKKRITLVANFMMNLIKKENFDEKHAQLQQQLKELQSKMLGLERELEEVHSTFPTKESPFILKNISLKRELQEVNQRLDELHRTLNQQVMAEQEIENEKMIQELRQRKQLELSTLFYKALLEKYADLINQSESKSVTQVKALIDSENLTIQSIAAKFKTSTFTPPRLLRMP